MKTSEFRDVIKPVLDAAPPTFRHEVSKALWRFKDEWEGNPKIVKEQVVEYKKVPEIVRYIETVEEVVKPDPELLKQVDDLKAQVAKLKNDKDTWKEKRDKYGSFRHCNGVVQAILTLYLQAFLPIERAIACLNLYSDVNGISKIMMSFTLWHAIEEDIARGQYSNSDKSRLEKIRETFHLSHALGSFDRDKLKKECDAMWD